MLKQLLPYFLYFLIFANIIFSGPIKYSSPSYSNFVNPIVGKITTDPTSILVLIKSPVTVGLPGPTAITSPFSFLSLPKSGTTMLPNFVSSFSDNGVGLKIFLNEELGRLKEKLKEAKQLSEIEESLKYMQKALKLRKNFPPYVKLNIDLLIQHKN